MRRRFLCRLALMAACLAASNLLPAQRPPPELRASAGLACFVDEAWCDVPHAAVGVAPHLYFSRSWSFSPEFLYTRSSWDYDLIFLPSLAANLRHEGSVRPYAIVGFGILRHRDLRFRTIGGTDWSLQGGFGFKIFLSPKVYVAPEFRLGWEPVFRLGASIGYVFAK